MSLWATFAKTIARVVTELATTTTNELTKPLSVFQSLLSVVTLVLNWQLIWMVDDELIVMSAS